MKNNSQTLKRRIIIRVQYEPSEYSVHANSPPK